MRTYLEPTPASVQAFFKRTISGNLVIFNPLRFCGSTDANYSAGTALLTFALDDSRLLPVEEGLR
jgi:hypothetical protein